MTDVNSVDDILAIQRKERKEILAKTQQMKHSIPRGDKKRKKEVASEIAQLMAALELRHKNEIKEYETKKLLVDLKNERESEGIPTKHIEVAEKCLSSSMPVCVNCPECNCDKKKCVEMLKTAQKLSKAQKRRNKKTQNEKERIKAIAEQEELNLSGLRNVESVEIRRKLSDRHLVIHEVPSDGNCLYKAVEHQLSTLNLKKTNVESLRQSTSEYLLAHKEEYIPFLTNPETGDNMSDEQFVKYCEDIVKTCAWGGHVEIQALSQVCGRAIEVIQAEGPSVIAGDENSNPKLIISYHRHAYGLGEHYNSVVPDKAVN